MLANCGLDLFGSLGIGVAAPIYGGVWQRGDSLLNRERCAGKGV
jgi:hypothetical protein